MASPLGVMTLPLLLLLVLLTASTCAGREFVVVSGPHGWTVPGEPLEHFQLKDTLVFRNDKHVDPVLVVNQSHYDACNTTDPSYVLDLDAIGVVLDTSGDNYFISGDAMRCLAGERLHVFVNYAVPGNTPSALAPPPPPPPKPASSSSAPPPPPPPKPVSTTPSSAVDLRAGVLLAFLVIGASAAIL